MLSRRLTTFQPTRRFPVQNGMPRAILMLGVPSAEAKESVARIVGFLERPLRFRRHSDFGTKLPEIAIAEIMALSSREN